MAQVTTVRLKALPVQLIEVKNRVILKRGCKEICFSGSAYAAKLRAILDAFQNGSTQEEVLKDLGDNHPDIAELIETLKDRNILVPFQEALSRDIISESPLDVFYWHFDPHGHSIRQKIQSRSVAVLGVNTVSQALCGALSACGFNVSLIAYPASLAPDMEQAFSSDLFDSNRLPQPMRYETWSTSSPWDSVDCLVATSDRGGKDLLRNWNALAVEQRCHFLPLVLQDVIGYLGPLVIPGETACFECLISRENSHMDEADLRRIIERTAYAAGTPAFHPIMASVLGQIAAFELVKHYSEAIPVRRVGTLIEVNLISASITTRKVLKVPRCLVCSSLNTFPSVAIHKGQV
jgi:bacteriocin biosynthesis cyclodehydratase domain-containing protein